MTLTLGTGRRSSTGHSHAILSAIEEKLEELLQGQRKLEGILQDVDGSIKGMGGASATKVEQRLSSVISEPCMSATGDLAMAPPIRMNSDGSLSPHSYTTDHPSVARLRSLDSSSKRRPVLSGWPQSVAMREALHGCADNSMPLAQKQASDRVNLVVGWLGSGKDNVLKPRAQGVKSSHNLAATSTIGTMGSYRGVNEIFSCRVMLDPDDRVVVALDLMGSLILCYDLVMTPIILAWEVETRGVLFFLAVLTACYWLVDMFFQFKVGYYEDGELVTNPKEVRKAYFKRWFLFDLCLQFCDWTLVLEFLITGGGSKQLLMLPRAARFLKLLRLSRLGRFIERLNVRHLTARSRLTMQLLQIVAGILLVHHVLACLWFFAGKRERKLFDRTWLDRIADDYRGEHVSEFWDTHLLFQYSTALLWVTAQVALASSSVVPANSFEGFVTIGLLIYGLLFGGTIVSILSAQTVQFVMVKQESTKKLALLLRYLKEQKVSRRLATLIRRQIVTRMRKEKCLTEEDVPILGMLALSLRQRLWYETRRPPLMTHALFRTWSHTEEPALQALCEIVKVTIFSRQDIIFTPRSPAEATYVVTHGNLTYTLAPPPHITDFEGLLKVNAGAWVSEAALWCWWFHVGMLEADSHSTLLQIPTDEFYEVVERHPVIGSLTQKYGRNFHLRLSSAVPPHSSYPHDLGVPHTDASDLLGQDVGLQLLRMAKKNGSLNLTGAEGAQLEAELSLEESALQLSPDGVLERIVAVVALRLERADGKILAQIGKREAAKAQLQIECVLPGGKRRRGELPQEGLARVLDNDYQGVLGLASFRATSHDIQAKSGRFGLPARYVRTTHMATVNSDDIEMLGEIIVHHPAWTFPEPLLCIETIRRPQGQSQSRNDVVPLPTDAQQDERRFVYLTWLTDSEFLRCQGLAADERPWAADLAEVEADRETWNSKASPLASLAASQASQTASLLEEEDAVDNI